MNKETDYASESDESDEDFCPNGMQSDVGSEEESEDISDDNDQDDVETTKKAAQKMSSKKRCKAKSSKRSNKRCKVEETPEDEKTDVSRSRQTRQREETHSKKIQEKDEIESDEEDKSRSEALWADFLSDVKPPSSSSTSKTNGTSSSTIQNGNKVSSHATNDSNKKEKKSINEQNTNEKQTPKVITVTEVVDFAGEAVSIQKTVPADSIKENKASVSKLTPPKTIPASIKRPVIGGPSGGGLGSILNQIGKKKKISVLEKTKLDWNTFKQTEGIEEQLQTFNKGKDGYLERQDFLQRTDVRQFEIEKSLRHSRKNQ